MKLTYYCDTERHLVCMPYSVENLHRMAQELKIGRGWFHSKKDKNLSHYDIPKGRIKEITAMCQIVSSMDIVKIIRGTYPHDI